MNFQHQLTMYIFYSPITPDFFYMSMHTVRSSGHFSDVVPVRNRVSRLPGIRQIVYYPLFSVFDLLLLLRWVTGEESVKPARMQWSGKEAAW